MPKIVKIEGLLIPETLEEARQIVPTCDEEQFRKWQEDGAVELLLEAVYEMFDMTPALILRDKTVPVSTTPYTEAAVLADVNIRLVLKEPNRPEITVEKSWHNIIIRHYGYHMSPRTQYEWVKLNKVLTEVDKTVKEEFFKDAKWCSDYLEELIKELEQRGIDATRRGEMWWTAREALEKIAKLYLIGEFPERGFYTHKREIRLLDATCAAEVKYTIKRFAYVLWPTKSYILKLQYVRIPPDMLPTDVEARSSFHRCGWLIKVTNIDPGFEGHIYVLLSPQPGAPPLVLEERTRVVQMRLLKLSEPLRGYSGQWKYM